MLAPLCAFLLLVAVFPTLYTWWVSFSDLRLGQPGTGSFVGLDNFVSFLTTDLTRNSLLKTGLFLLVGLPIQLVAGFALAKLFAAVHDVRGMQVLRTLYLLPVMVTPLLIGLMWQYILNPLVGIANWLLEQVGLPQPEWLSSTGYTFWVVLGLEVWQWLPLVTMIIFAGLLSIPPEVREAAALDGAGTIRTALYVEVPMLRRIIGIALILAGIQLISAFSIVLAATQGGPGSTTVVSSFAIYREAFVYFNTGSAAAGALILLILTIVLSQIFARIVFRGQEQEA